MTASQVRSRAMYRPKPQPDPETACAIGVDVGGTKIAAGVVTWDGSILQSTSVATPPNADGASMLDISSRMIERLRAQHPAVRAIGVGAAGHGGLAQRTHSLGTQ